MVNQQLLDYIKQQLEQNVSREQIKNSLMANGWQAQDVEEGFNATNPSAPIEQDLNFPIKAPVKIWKIIIASLVALAIIGGGVYFATQKLFKSKEAPKLSNEQTQQPPKETTSSTPAQETPAYVDCGSSDSCFFDHVKTCAPAKAIISNQGLTYMETIEGYAGNDCILTLVYTESPVPGFVGKKMTCKVPKSNLANFKDYLQGEETMKQSCEGPLIDLIIQMGAE